MTIADLASQRHQIVEWGIDEMLELRMLVIRMRKNDSREGDWNALARHD